MSTSASATRLLVGAVVAAVVAFGTVAVVPADSASAATNPSCRVVNVTRGGTYKTLAAAVRAARNGNKLVVKGTCKGATTIVGKRLVIKGEWTPKKGAPTLRSNGKNPVLTLAGDGANVSLKKLTIRGDPATPVKSSGAGIKVDHADGGVLKLVDVKVKDLRTKGYGGCIANYEGNVYLWGKTTIAGCAAPDGNGGGIYNQSGKLVMSGQTVIKRNRAKWGGGVASIGLFAVASLQSDAALKDNSASYQGGGLYVLHSKAIVGGNARVSGNSAASDGGGIMIEGEAIGLTLAGNSRVVGNTAGFGGGGVKFKGDLMTMTDSSSITGNSATLGGGLNSAGWTTLVGVVCAPAAEANVSGNSPDDCHRG